MFNTHEHYAHYEKKSPLHILLVRAIAISIYTSRTVFFQVLK